MQSINYLGSIRQVIYKTADYGNNNITGARDYYPYGRILRETNNAQEERFKFTEKERDKETDFDYFGARYYDSGIGRWTTADPLGDKYYGWSPYAYTLCNPLRFIDIKGFVPGEPPGAGYYVAGINTRTLGFILRHPIAAINIGAVSSGKINISTNAVRFSTQIGLMENNSRQGSQVNAFRHALWQSTITSKYGQSIAAQAGNVHETNPFADLTQRNFMKLNQADQTIDLLNNKIGRQIGSASSKLTMKQLAIKVLNYYKKNGLWVAQKQKDGYSIVKETLSEEQYKQAFDIIKGLNEEGYKLNPR